MGLSARFLTSAALLFLVFGLTSCGRARADQRQRVLIWHQKNPVERVVFDRIIAEYNASHPDRVVEALYRENEELRNLYIIASVAGQGPDLIYGPSDNVGVYALTQTIKPLDDIVPAEMRAEFMPEAFVEYEGKHWMLADQIGSHLMLICDRAKVTTPPRTSDELIALGQQLKTDRAQTGRPEEYGLTWNYREPFFFIPFLTAFGGWVMDEEGRPTFDNPKTAAALQFILDLRDRHKIIPREGDYEIADALFREQRAAMIINGPWSWGNYGIPEKAMIAPLPVMTETGLPWTPMFSFCGYSINTNVPAPKLPLVREVMAHLTGREVQLQYAAKLLLAPTRHDVRAAPEVQANAALQVSLQQLQRARALPIRPEMRQIWDGMRGPYQLIMSGSVSAREGARLMQRECERLIRDAQM